MSEAIARELMAQRFRSYLPVVVDLETGGFNAQGDAVLEIAAVTLTMDPEGNLLPDATYAYHIHPFEGAAVNRCGIKRNPFHPFSSFDTATLAGLIYGQTVLARACRAAGIEFDNKAAHSARYDTERTAELFCSMVNRYKDLGGWQLAQREQEMDGTE